MFPAGILQPPFYHKHFPKSLNYGGIGVVIGHEITHGFDDKGRQFDHIGNINQGWDHESSERFHNRAQCIIDQYKISPSSVLFSSILRHFSWFMSIVSLDKNKELCRKKI